MEFGQQRQQVTLKKFHFTVQELVQLFAQTFQTTLDLENYDISLANQLLNPSIELNFMQMGKYPRFKIRLRNTSTIIGFSTDEIVNEG